MNTSNPMPEEQDARLAARIANAFPTTEVSPDLRRRLDRLAPEQRATRPPHRWPAPAFGLTGRIAAIAAVGGACCVVALLGRTPANAIERIDQALKDARSAHFITFDIQPDGSRKKVDEFWYADGRWRVENSLSTTICEEGYCTRYVPGSNLVERRKADRPEGYEMWQGFSLTSQLAMMKAPGSPKMDLVKVREDVDSNRRPVTIYRVTGELYPQFETLITVDKGTDLPVEVESYRIAGSSKRLDHVIRQTYNIASPPDTFQLDFPKTAEYHDLDREKAEAQADWKQRLEEGVAQQTKYLTTVVIRDFQVSAAGDVFVLFTDGSKPGSGMPNSMELTDDQGTKYLTPDETFRLGPPQSSNGTIFSWVAGCLSTDPATGNPKPDGIVIAGQEVTAVHFVPVSSGFSPTFPRRYTLKRTVGDKVTFSFAVNKPAVEVLPTYVSLMARPAPAAGIQENDRMVRAAWLRHHEGKKEEALALYRKQEEIDRQQKPEGEDRNLGMAEAETLLEMNRPEEARRLLERIETSVLYNKFEVEQLHKLQRRANNEL